MRLKSQTRPPGQVENTLSGGNVNTFFQRLGVTGLPGAEAAAARSGGAGGDWHGAVLCVSGGGLGIRAGDGTGNCEGYDDAADDEFHGVAPYWPR